MLGVHFVSWEGALTHFSCKLGLKNFFQAYAVVQGVHPLATPMISTSNTDSRSGLDSSR